MSITTDLFPLAAPLATGVVTGAIALTGVLLTQRRADRREEHKFGRELDTWTRDQRFDAYKAFVQANDDYWLTVAAIDQAAVRTQRRQNASKLHGCSTSIKLLGSANTVRAADSLLAFHFEGQTDVKRYRRLRNEVDDTFRADLGLDRLVVISKQALQDVLDDMERRSAEYDALPAPRKVLVRARSFWRRRRNSHEAHTAKEPLPAWIEVGDLRLPRRQEEE